MRVIGCYIISLFALLLFRAIPLEAQSIPDSIPRIPAEISTLQDSLPVAPDSIWHEYLNSIDVFPKGKRVSKREVRRYTRLMHKIKKVYPYAKLASTRLEEYNAVYITLNSERERRRYMKDVEASLFKEFSGDVKKLKISEGRILIKLIDREAGISSFEIIKEFKGGFSAFLWQSVARLFGHNLKAKYDPYGEDRMIENIVWQIEKGYI